MYKFFHNDTNAVYATKVTSIKEYLCTNDESRNEKRWKAIIRELCILEALDSPYVIKPVEFIRTGSNIYLIQEFANGGSVQSLLDKRTRFSEAEAKLMLHQLLKGFLHLYEH